MSKGYKTIYYYPFGMMMPGRMFVLDNSGYRYGFNGKEKDNEVKGDNNCYDYGARMHDPRVGRWLSVDSKISKYPGLSPYNFCANSPLIISDPDGRDLEIKGSDAEFAKLQAVISKSTNGMINLIRDAHNIVTMNIKNSDGSAVTDVNKWINDNKISTANQVYNVFNSIIKDPKTTKAALVEGEERKKVIGGSFRGGLLNGEYQKIDMDDFLKFPEYKDVPTGTGLSQLSGVIHELQEAFMDQVKLGSKNKNYVATSAADYKKAWDEAFAAPHKSALEVQGQFEWTQYVENVATETNGKVTSMTIITAIAMPIYNYDPKTETRTDSGKRTMWYHATTYSVKDNNIGEKINSGSGKPVIVDGKSTFQYDHK